MSEEAIKNWETEAWLQKEPLDKLPVPFHVLVGEAVDVARFCQRNWDPATDRAGNVVRPGLSASIGNGSFTDQIADEILELQAALQTAQTKYRLLASAAEGAPVERAQFVLSEIRATLEWCFDDGVIDQQDAQLDRLGEAHDKAYSHDAIAAALFDYAELADRVQAKIEGLGGFDLALIDEARELAQRLREQSAGPAQVEPAPAEREALRLRNRIGTLLYERMQRARAAARFAFRRHPELVREVTSAYARRQRAAYRRAQAEQNTQEVPVASA